jgi:cobalamin biosynthesis protein CobD/CbiB
MLKTIFITITATLTVVTLAAHLFLNSILGMFGLVATSVETLSKLQASHEVVQKMKSRQLRKQKRISKRFVKRSGKRVASGALAAVTVGAVAAVAAMTTIEVADYCEEQKGTPGRYGSHQWD